MRLRIYGQLDQVLTVARWFDDMRGTPMIKNNGVTCLILDNPQLPMSDIELDELNVVIKVVGSAEEVLNMKKYLLGYFDIHHIVEFEKTMEDKEIIFLHCYRIDMSKIGKKEDGKEVTLQQLIKWRDWQFNKIKQSIY